MTPDALQAFPIEPGQRVAIVGSSGTGKSWATGSLLQPQPQRAIILDPKRTDSLNRWGWRTIEDLDLLDTFAQDDPHEKLVVRFPWNVTTKDLFEQVEMISRWAFQTGDMIVYLDEIKQVCPTPQTCPPSLRGLCILGRERGVGFWGATQRPVGVPVEMLSEANHNFIFALNKETDRKRIGEAVESDIEGEIKGLEDRQFVYMNPRKRLITGPHWFE